MGQVRVSEDSGVAVGTVVDAPAGASRGTAARADCAVTAVLDGVVAVDSQGLVTLLNPAAERLLGIRPMTSLGRPIDDFADAGELVAALCEERSRVGAGREATRVVEVHREGSADLTYVRVIARSLKDHQGQSAGVLFQVQDVTSEHKTDQLKNQYLSIVAHELRTPLTGIKTFSTMMAKGVLGPLNQRQTTVVESIREQSLRLEHQIDKLVNLGHIDSDEYARDLERLDAVDVLRQSVAAFEVTAKDRDISVDIRLPDSPRFVDGDRADLKRALQALVENAIKFTRDGGQVRVELADVADGRVGIAVQDDGAGIEPRYQGRIFEKFFQVEDPLTRHHGGSGLGLFFVKSIVEAHGSEVRVESVLGEGARFSFELTSFASSERPVGEGRGAGTPQSALPIPGKD